jgi:photosystem II stability/assembly factor-like uncharacterized protein
MPTTVDLEVPSGTVVWALVGSVALFRSMDQGLTWEQRPLPRNPIPPSDMAFADDRMGWLVTNGQGGACVLDHTADGGATWERIAASGLTVGRCAPSFVDADRGFISVSAEHQAPIIYSTADGGATWAGSAALTGPSGCAYAGYSLMPGKVRAFGRTLLVSAGQCVFRSTDGGVTWAYLATLPGNGAPALVTATRWILVSVPGQSRETLDAGSSWRPYPSDYSQAAGVAPFVIFGDSQVGYATVRGGLQRTLDGGQHWSHLSTPGTSSP